MTAPVPGCALCEADGGQVVVRRERWRLVRAAEAGFPAFYRLVWNQHVQEFSDLGVAERSECMDTIATVEALLRAHLRPTKVNLATLGNVVPHLHWHVIGRYDWDSHFPAPVWAPAQRTAPPDRLGAVEALLPSFEKELVAQLGPAA